MHVQPIDDLRTQQKKAENTVYLLPGLGKIILFFSLMIILFLVSMPIARAQTQDSNPDRLQIKQSIMTVQELEHGGFMTHADAENAIAYYVSQASTLEGHPLTLQEIMATPEPVPQQITPLQEFVGTIDFLHVMLVLAIIAIAGAVGYLFKRSVAQLLQLLRQIPVLLYEIIFYTFSLGCSLGGWFLAEPMHGYIGLAGALLLAAAFRFSVSHHPYLKNGFLCFLMLFLIWTTEALLFASPLIGFIAVGALLATLSYRKRPTHDGRNFHYRMSWNAATFASFMLQALFVILHVFKEPVPFLSLFEFGALFIGSFFGYWSLLCMSLLWYIKRDRIRYWIVNGVCVLAGIGALFFGSVFHINELQKIGGTFFVIYCILTSSEIPVRSEIAYAMLILLISVLTLGFCWFVLTHQTIFQQFLFMPG